MRLRRLRSDLVGRKKMEINVVCDVCFCYFIDGCFFKEFIL